jgi:hypothetical protein
MLIIWGYKKIGTARLSDTFREVPHRDSLIRIQAVFVPCGHGRPGRQLKDQCVFHAFLLTERYKSNKRSIGKAQPMLTRVEGGLILAVLTWCSDIQSRIKCMFPLA